MNTWSETTSLRNFNQEERYHRVVEIAECFSTHLEGSGNTVWPLDVQFGRAQHIEPNAFRVNNIVTTRDSNAMLGCVLKNITFGNTIVPAIYVKGVHYPHTCEKTKSTISHTTLLLDPKLKNWVEKTTGFPFIIGAQLFSSDADSVFAPPVISEFDAIVASYAMAIHESLPPNELRLPRCNETVLLRYTHNLVVNERKALEDKVLVNVMSIYWKLFTEKPKEEIASLVREYCKNIALQIVIPEKSKVYERKLAELRSICG